MPEEVKNNGQPEEGDQKGDDSSSKDNTPKEVPYERFQEVVKDKQTYLQDKENLESENETLKSQIKDLEGKSKLSSEEKKELGDKKDISREIEEIIERREKGKIESEQQEQKKFNREVDKQVDLFPDVEKEKFLDFMEKEADEFGINSVEGGMKAYRRMNNLTKETRENALNEFKNKPNMPRSEGGGGEESPSSDKNKTLSQIAEEVVREQMNS